MLLTAGVVVFGAFVRLSDAGLSCPDWPTCYGRATWPSAAHDAAAHAASEIRPFETHKAWREQVHRHLAATLGTLVLLLAILAARRRRFGVLQVVGASLLVVGAVLAYMRGQIESAFALAGAGEVILLFAALRWSNRGLSGPGQAPDMARVAVLTPCDHFPGAARAVDGDPAAEADRGDGPSAWRPYHVLAAAVDGLIVRPTCRSSWPMPAHCGAG